MKIKETISNLSNLKADKKLSLSKYIYKSVENYLSHLDGHIQSNLYQILIKEIETPILEAVLKHTKYNKTETASILGINRGTLRKKIKQYDL